MPQFLNVKQLYERLGASRAALSRWLTEWRMRHQVVDLIHRLLPWVKERLILLSRWLFRTWSPRWNTFAVVGSAVFIVVPLLGTLLGYKPSTVILWATGLVVLAYTIEAYRMRLELARQNEMAIQPLVIATIEDREVQRVAIGTENFLVLRNIGRGTALFIEIKDVEFAELEGQRYVMKFSRIDYIEPGSDHITHPDIFRGNEQTASSAYVSHLDPRYAIQNLTVVITYEDINGQKRESVVLMGKDGIRLLSHQTLRL